MTGPDLRSSSFQEEFGEALGRALVFWVIFSQQPKPSAMMRVIALAERTAGSSTTSRRGLRDFVFIAFEAEGTGHAAADGVEQGDVRAGRAQDGLLVVHGQGGLMVAVAMD